MENWREQLSICREWARLKADIKSKVDELESIVAEMRLVEDGTFYLSEDHNRFVRAWRVLLDIDEVMAPTAPEVSELSDVVNQMVEIKAGDIYMAELHNLFADAWDLQVKINETYIENVVVILPRNDWDAMLDWIVDGAVVFIDPQIDTATPSDVRSVLNKYRVKFMVMMDTQPYRATYCGAWRDILYSVNYFTGRGCGSLTIYKSHDADHFGATSVEEHFDYFPLNRDRAPDVEPWTTPYPDYWGYKYVGKGVVVEVPYDGCWVNTNWLDKYITWKPCSYPETWQPTRIIVISLTGTDLPEFHEYPTLDETLKAWAEKKGWSFKDLR
ncbi:MAG: hypothetical protein DRJ67_11295 [Thermoprotei archaeon]|nr:MAG: hypothetical protein DRJ67_11295 [Thermoprotei archaeon]